MGKEKALTDFSIRYDHPDRVYHAGEKVKGTVRVELSRPKAMSDISVTVHGRAKVKWRKWKDEQIYYYAGRKYIKEKVVLVKHDQPGQKLPAGVHLFDFSVDIPQSAPTSLESKHGYIRYFSEATIDHDFSEANINIDEVDFNECFNQHHVNEPFTVVQHLDLNKEQDQYKIPVIGEDITQVSCLCCISGDVKASFKVNKRLFVPGAPIEFQAKVENNSDTALECARVTLIQDIVFYGISNAWTSSGKLKPKSRSWEVMNKWHEMSIPQRSTEIWEERLFVPAVPPSRTEGCDIISISYKIQFSVGVPYGDDLKLTTDIVIGTIPLHEVPASDDQGPAAKQPAPPSYEECISGGAEILLDETDQDAHHSGGYVPHYTFYSHFQEQNQPLPIDMGATRSDQKKKAKSDAGLMVLVLV